MKDAVFKKNGKIYRYVYDIRPIEQIINIFEKNNIFSTQIVETTIIDKTKNLLEHKFISPIIHSGEFTTSMALDTTKLSIDMTLNLMELGVYTFDLLPHQYTYTNGKWIMYDFDSFELRPIHLKAEFRSIFKVSFSSFELLKFLPRKELKHLFLNRINHSYLSKMLPFYSYLKWACNLECCLFLNNLKLHKLAVILLKKYYNNYAKNIERKSYNYIFSQDDKNIFELIDKILTKENIISTFSIGEKAAQWSINSKNNAIKFIYLDDYDRCDRFYNYISQNNYNNISTAVIYPFMQDNEIPKSLKYRGIYDYFAKERYCADSVVILNSDEFSNEKEFNIETFCKNIVEFSTHFYLHKFDRIKEKTLANKFKIELEKYYQNIQCLETMNYIILIAKNKKKEPSDYSKLKQYENFNRGPLSKEQNIEIIELLKQNSHRLNI